MILNANTINFDTSSLDTLDHLNRSFDFAVLLLQVVVVVEEECIRVSSASVIERSVDIVLVHAIIKGRPLGLSEAPFTVDLVDRLIDHIVG